MNGLSTTNLRAVVVGLGSSGQRHLRNLQTLGLRDIAVQTSRPESARSLTDGVVMTSISEALDWKPDLVLVCTPTPSHVPIACAAAEDGCHLFIEKPLSDSVDGVANLQRLVNARSLTLLVGFDLRFEPGLCQVKEWINEGRIGRVLSVQAQVGQYLPDWRPSRRYQETVSARAHWGGGVLLELCHELDYLCWLLGPVCEISCFKGRVSDLDIDVEDVAAMVLRFQSGAIGSVHLDCLQRVPSRTCRIIGTLGTIEWSPLEHEARITLPNGAPVQVVAYPEFTRDSRFAMEMRHLLDCIEGNAMPKADLTSAISNLKVVLAAKRSADTGTVCQPGAIDV